MYIHLLKILHSHKYELLPEKLGFSIFTTQVAL